MGAVWVYEQNRNSANVKIRLQFSAGINNALDSDGYMYVELYKESSTGTLTYNDRSYILDSTYTTEAEKNEYMWRMTSFFYLSYDARYLVKCKFRRWNESYGTYFANLQLCYVTAWDWDISNGTATEIQTQEAKKAVDKVSGYKTPQFNHLVWNDIVEKVDKMIFHLNDEWNVYYDTYENTKMLNTLEGRTLTAKRFNSLRYNIGSRYATGISDVYSYNDSIGAENYTVYGHYFTTLTTKLNEWIGSKIDFKYMPPGNWL